MPIIVPPHRAHPDDGRIGFGDDGVGYAEQNSEEKAHSPARPGQACCAYYKSDGKSRDKRRRDGGLFIRKAHRQHDPDIYRAKHQTADET